MPPRPTQLDIARKAGLSRPTVSLALNGSPTISAKTRAFVRRVADELGYQPDPMLSALSRYRNSNKTKDYRGMLAWISFSPKTFPWHWITPYSAYHRGATRRAHDLGFDIEAFDLKQQRLSPKRLAGILEARGIRGMLICPPTEMDSSFRFPVENQSFVTFGYSVQTPVMHRVTASHYRATKTAFARLTDAGCRRIGFIGSLQVNIKTQDLVLSAYLSACHNQKLDTIPPLIDDPITPAAILAWYRRHKPDAVLITSPIWPALLETGISIPDKLSVVSPMVPAHFPELTGVMEKSEQIGVAAVDTLLQLIQHDDHGIAEHPRNILIEGEWNEGSTVRPVAT
jgi:DNA-binding LacI/PurR family transcriptional regulator